MEGEWEINVDGLKLPTFKPGFFVWEAAPVVAIAMIEELRRARHKRQCSHHIILIPGLMQPEWRKALSKASDLVLSVPVGHEAWPEEMYEPLTIAFIFPFLHFRPWQLRRSPYLLEMGRQLSGLWRSNGPGERPLLRKLWSLQRQLSKMPEELARKVLYSESNNELQDRNPRKRRRGQVEKEERRISFCKR
jgi:hypothetical protein